MGAAELAALITALGVSIGAVLTATAAIISARNSAATVEHLKLEVAELQAHNAEQDRALISRESDLNILRRANSDLQARLEQKDMEIASLIDKIDKWQSWGFNIGRLLNEMQLEIGFLTKKKTGPLPPLPNDR